MDFQLNDNSLVTTVGANTGSSVGTALTSVTAHVKTAWVELTSSAPGGTTALLVNLGRTEASSGWYVDIGIGAASSEVVLLPDLRQFVRADSGGSFFYIPMTIPAGTRVAARAQCGYAAKTIWVTLGFLQGGLLTVPPFGKATHYGLVSASTTGTEIDPGASAHTKGSWVQLTSSCNQIRSLYCIIGNGSTAGSPPDRLTGGWLFDVAIGAASSEKVILSNIQLHSNAQNDSVYPSVIGPIDYFIPSGTRIAVRAQSVLTDATRRLFDISILGLN